MTRALRTSLIHPTRDELASATRVVPNRDIINKKPVAPPLRALEGFIDTIVLGTLQLDLQVRFVITSQIERKIFGLKTLAKLL